MQLFIQNFKSILYESEIPWLCLTLLSMYIQFKACRYISRFIYEYSLMLFDLVHVVEDTCIVSRCPLHSLLYKLVYIFSFFFIVRYMHIAANFSSKLKLI